MAELRLTYMAEVRLDIDAIYYFEQLSPKTVVNESPTLQPLMEDFTQNRTELTSG